jgi:hypothetical protein
MEHSVAHEPRQGLVDRNDRYAVLVGELAVCLKLSADRDLAGNDSLANVRRHLLVERRGRTGIDTHVIDAF